MNKLKDAYSRYDEVKYELRDNAKRVITDVIKSSGGNKVRMWESEYDDPVYVTYRNGFTGDVNEFAIVKEIYLGEDDALMFNLDVAEDYEFDNIPTVDLYYVALEVAKKIRIA